MKWAPHCLILRHPRSQFSLVWLSTACNKPLIINIYQPPTRNANTNDKKLWKCFFNASSLNFFRFLIFSFTFQRCRHFSIIISPHNVVFIMQTYSSIIVWLRVEKMKYFCFFYLLIASKRFFFAVDFSSGNWKLNS